MVTLPPFGLLLGPNLIDWLIPPSAMGWETLEGKRIGKSLEKKLFQILLPR
ncbi:hypothetical protein [Methylacidiphilum kamchatkense]|uniref:hypothetical protein n=1 Tax=Methylacidiphilum kamchatkense TaxID=431057 RepID=UPI000B0B3257|nr:hypothetical protein [Methylacidiphilum kamchatkense]